MAEKDKAVKAERASLEKPPPAAARAVDDEAYSDEERVLEARLRTLEKRKALATMAARTRSLEEELAQLEVKAEPERGRSRSRGKPRRKQRVRSSSSSSEARTPSLDRRLKRKWSLKHHTREKKCVTKLNPHELVEASCMWMLDVPDTTVGDFRKFVRHIAYMSGKARADRFWYSAHIGYDTAVRKEAVKEGFGAFGPGNQEHALDHYSFENVRSRKAAGAQSADTGNVFIKDGKRPCYSHNKLEGCATAATECTYGHWCAKCGSTGHKRAACKKD